MIDYVSIRNIIELLLGRYVKLVKYRFKLFHRTYIHTKYLPLCHTTATAKQVQIILNVCTLPCTLCVFHNTKQCLVFLFTAVQHERAPRCYQYKRDSPELGKDDKQPDIHAPFPSPAFLDRARYM